MLTRALFTIALGCCAPMTAGAQPAQTPPKNLQVLPRDTPRPALIQRMREFSFALGVRCQYCHTGGDGISFDGVVFESDEKLAKQKARAMLRLVDMINTSLLPQVPGRSQPPATVDCVTCHRGLAVPKTIETVLLDTVARDGAAAAVRQYRDLRTKEALTGRYDFDEWRVNEVARVLVERKNVDAAIALLEMNGEFHPGSAAIDRQLGDLFMARGDRAVALARFRSVLQKEPGNARAKRLIAELEAKP
jgi:hypothetical protein